MIERTTIAAIPPLPSAAPGVTAPSHAARIASDGGAAAPGGGSFPRPSAGGQRNGRTPETLPLPDPDRPTGPPPAFEANVLDAEAERRRNAICRPVEAGSPFPAVPLRPTPSFDRTA